MAAHHVNRIAPNYVHAGVGPSSSSSNTKDDSFTFTVGKLDAGMAILIGDRASLIEFPSLLLPQGVSSGSVVNIRVLRNQHEEHRQKSEFDQLQHDILESFGKEAPKPPALRLRNVTQTSVTLEWDRLSLATASLLSLDIYRNGQRLAPIPNPLHNTSTKLSGLDVDAEYTFHLVLKTSAGTFSSPVIRTRTHTITDTSGISVCFGHVSDPEVLEAAREALSNMRAKWSDRIQIDTTHFVCTDPRNPGDTNAVGGQGNGYAKAMQLSIPVVKPHWIFACHDQKKMVNISPFYLDQDPPNASTLRESITRIRGKPPSAGGPAAAASGSPPQQQPTRAAAAEATATRAGAEASTAAAEAMDVSVPPAPTTAGIDAATASASEGIAAATVGDEESDREPEGAGDSDLDLPPIPASMITTNEPHAVATPSAPVITNELGLQLADTDVDVDVDADAKRPIESEQPPRPIGRDAAPVVSPPLGSPNPSIEVTAPGEESGTPIGFDDEGEEVPSHFSQQQQQYYTQGRRNVMQQLEEQVEEPDGGQGEGEEAEEEETDEESGGLQREEEERAEEEEMDDVSLSGS